MRRGDHGVTIVIPARFSSSRFPGKPLAMLAGKPLIQHVYERAGTASGISRVVVATDDVRILDAVKAFGGHAMMLDGPFRTGTDRVAGAARQLPGDIFVNLQGDEIMLHAGLLGELMASFLDSEAGMGTLKRRLTSDQEVSNPGVVKVVTDDRGRALYFSRAGLPHIRDGQADAARLGLHYVHLGLYIFRRDTLLRFAELPTGRLEDAEKLEQLRALEHGIAIHVWETGHQSLRIDTPDDLAHAVSVLERRDTAGSPRSLLSSEPAIN